MCNELLTVCSASLHVLRLGTGSHDPHPFDCIMASLSPHAGLCPPAHFSLLPRRARYSSEVGSRWPACKVEPPSEWGEWARPLYGCFHILDRAFHLCFHIRSCRLGQERPRTVWVSFMRTILPSSCLPVSQWLGYSKRRKLELRQRSSVPSWQEGKGRALSVPLSQVGCQLLWSGWEGKNFPIA